MRNRSKGAIGAAILGIATAATALPPSPTALSDQITVTARRVPANSGSQVYEAQFAALLDRTGATCSQFHDAALGATNLPRTAYVALQRLDRSTAACTGTAAIGGGRANNTGVPGFSVGGGSDYVR